ncbi:GNAT family N-acetyltransferase [Pseudoalteromonas piscicida]
MEIEITQGWDIEHTQTAAELYVDAFGSKFKAAVPDRNKLITIIAKSFISEYSFAAFADGKLVGVAGFQYGKSGFTSNMGFTVLIDELGLLGGIKAAAVFTLFERKPAPNEVVMDGIAVAESVRGQGVGTALLVALQRYTKQSGFHALRLDVIDSNPQAKKLYMRMGFVASHHEDFSYLNWLIGFSGATTMLWRP